MASRRCEVGLGDAVRAARLLGLQDRPDRLRELVQMLGLPVSDFTPEPVTRAPSPPEERHQSASSRGPAAPEPDVLPPARPREAAAEVVRSVSRLVVQELEPEAPLELDLTGEATLGGAPAELPVVRYQPPLAPNRLRAAIAMLLRRGRVGREPDVTQLVAAFAACRPIAAVPLEFEHSVARGATVVVDVGPDMTPFFLDSTYFLAQIRGVIGQSRVLVFWSDDAQRRLSLRDDRPVIIISTLGEGRSPRARPGSRGRWTTALEQLRRVEADVVALVPHRRSVARSDRDGFTHFVAWDDLGRAGRGKA